MDSTSGSANASSSEESNGADTTNLSELASNAAEQLQTAAQPLKEDARQLAEEQKERGADRIKTLAQAVHGAAEEIGKQVPQAAGYIHSGAEQLERASRMLRENSVDDLLQMTKRPAREQPLAFIGGSVAAGFVLARFLRSSSAASGPEARP
jgi:ABC-type transporter Mla subunit MlaD